MTKEERIKDIAHKTCTLIGCSGLSPDMCKNNPQNCSIIRKVLRNFLNSIEMEKVKND